MTKKYHMCSQLTAYMSSLAYKKAAPKNKTKKVETKCEKINPKVLQGISNQKVSATTTDGVVTIDPTNPYEPTMPVRKKSVTHPNEFNFAYNKAVACGSEAANIRRQ